ncbi:MAG TPA: thioredoxin domain-containing protein [Acidimicrobiales bacterium]|nr:thioredoxin domain-containing protein [Acidimicrobiales bacterium]
MEPSVAACSSCGTRNRVPAEAAGSPRCARCHQALAWIVDADDGTFAGVAEASPLPVVVDLWAPWCGPCRVVGPLLEQLAGELAGRLKLVRVNVDKAPGVQRRFGVRGIPTLVVLREGREVGRKMGAAPLGELRAWVESSMTPTA